MNEMPANFQTFKQDHPNIWEAYHALGEQCSKGGPLDGKTSRLIKLAIAMANGSEGATHSHARRALEEGLAADELRHVALLLITTAGFPQAMAALSWVEDVISAKTA